jgi:hypothetical protein
MKTKSTRRAATFRAGVLAFPGQSIDRHTAVELVLMGARLAGGNPIGWNRGVGLTKANVAAIAADPLLGPVLKKVNRAFGPVGRGAR